MAMASAGRHPCGSGPHPFWAAPKSLSSGRPGLCYVVDGRGRRRRTIAPKNEGELMERKASLGLLAALLTAACLHATSAEAAQSKCLVGKNKCMSKKAGSLLKCQQKAETPGKPTDPNSGDCVTKAKAKFDGGPTRRRAASRSSRTSARTTASPSTTPRPPRRPSTTASTRSSPASIRARSTRPSAASARRSASPRS